MDTKFWSVNLKRQFGRLIRRWEDNIEINLTEVGYKDLTWVHLDEGKVQWRALANTGLSLRNP